VVLCRKPELIEQTKFTAGYQARKESFDLGKHSPEGSRPAFSLFLHAGLNLLGQKGYGYLVDEGIRKAKILSELVKTCDEFELLEEPQTNIVNYRYVPEELREKYRNDMLSDEDHLVINSINEVLQDEEFQLGKTFASRSVLKQSKYGNVDIVSLRAVISNPLTTENDLNALIDDQAEIGKYIVSQRQFSLPEAINCLYQQTSSGTCPRLRRI
jgi:glutamate decarboxylase